MATRVLAPAAASLALAGCDAVSAASTGRHQAGRADGSRYVYGPPARRREALAILDSLRIRPAPFHDRLHAAHFPRASGWRDDELPLYRILGRFAGRYHLDLWVFYGRRHPSAAQRAAAQRELGGVRWPAWL